MVDWKILIIFDPLLILKITEMKTLFIVLVLSLVTLISSGQRAKNITPDEKKFCSYFTNVYVNSSGEYIENQIVIKNKNTKVTIQVNDKILPLEGIYDKREYIDNGDILKRIINRLYSNEVEIITKLKTNDFYNGCMTTCFSFNVIRNQDKFNNINQRLDKTSNQITKVNEKIYEIDAKHTEVSKSIVKYVDQNDDKIYNYVNDEDKSLILYMEKKLKESETTMDSRTDLKINEVSTNLSKQVSEVKKDMAVNNSIDKAQTKKMNELINRNLELEKRVEALERLAKSSEVKPVVYTTQNFYSK